MVAIAFGGDAAGECSREFRISYLTAPGLGRSREVRRDVIETRLGDAEERVDRDQRFGGRRFRNSLLRFPDRIE